MKRKRRKMETHFETGKKAKNGTENHERRHNNAKKGHANGNFNIALAYGQWTIYAKLSKYGKNKTNQREDKAS